VKLEAAKGMPAEMEMKWQKSVTCQLHAFQKTDAFKTCGAGGSLLCCGRDILECKM
jgi:hypothetical protein